MCVYIYIYIRVSMLTFVGTEAWVHAPNSGASSGSAFLSSVATIPCSLTAHAWARNLRLGLGFRA